PTAEGVRAGTEPGEDEDRVLQGRQPTRLASLRAVRVPVLRVPSPSSPDQGRQVLRRVQPRLQPQGGPATPRRNPSVAALSVDQQEPERTGRVDKPPSPGLAQPLRR